MSPDSSTATSVDRSVVEALLFASDEPLTPAQIKKVLGEVEAAQVRAVLEAIRAELDERSAGFTLVEVAGGYQFRTRPEHSSWIRMLRSERPPRLSKPALETLAVVSYRQPVTRAEIEAIRRVDTGAVIKTLLDRRLIRVVGQKDVPGRPALYGTGREFLEVFRLKSLKELPTLKEIREVAAEMGDALEVPRELLPEGITDPPGDDVMAAELESAESESSEHEPVEDLADGTRTPGLDQIDGASAPRSVPNGLEPIPPSGAAEED